MLQVLPTLNLALQLTHTYCQLANGNGAVFGMLLHTIVVCCQWVRKIMVRMYANCLYSKAVPLLLA